MDVVDLFDRVTAWTQEKVRSVGPDVLSSPTPCEKWSVRDLLNHMVGVLRNFEAATRGEQIGRPPEPPPDLIGDRHPAEVYAEARDTAVKAYRAPGAADATSTAGKEIPRLGIAVTDQLVHGWDLAVATGQDSSMPPDLAEGAWEIMYGFIPDVVRGEGMIFEQAVEVPDDASAQERLLGYLGRDPRAG